MKSQLVIGLGNTLMGDEGIGLRVAECLASDPRLPADTDVLCAGTDLLRYADRMEGRRRILLIDALLGGSEPGSVEFFADPLSGLEERRPHAHHFSLPETIHLLRIASPSLDPVRFTLLAVVVASANIRCELSPALGAKVPDILDRVLGELRR